MRIAIRPEWLLTPSDSKPDSKPFSLPVLLQLLALIESHGSIIEAARDMNLSYRNAWGLLRDFDRQFGAPLVVKSRGQGSKLSSLAEKLLWADKRIAARLSPTLDSLASELEAELKACSAPHARHCASAPHMVLRWRLWWRHWAKRARQLIWPIATAPKPSPHWRAVNVTWLVFMCRRASLKPPA